MEIIVIIVKLCLSEYMSQRKQEIDFPKKGPTERPSKDGGGKNNPEKDGADYKLLGFIIGPVIGLVVACVAYYYLKSCITKEGE